MSSATRTVRARLAEVMRQPYVWGLVAIVVLLLVNLAKDPGYLALSVNDQNGHVAGNLIDIMRAAAPILLIATGMTLVIATGGIDLSVGSIMVVSGAVSMEFLQSAGEDAGTQAAFTAVLLSLAIGTALGLVNGVLVAFVGLQPFISTLVMMLAGRGLAKVITEGQNTAAVNPSFRWISNGYVLGLPVVFFLAVAIVLVVGLVVRRSALGLLIEAIGVNLRAARMAGVKPRNLLLAVYV
ncbi:ABC transporter permease, partial [bacterium]